MQSVLVTAMQHPYMTEKGPPQGHTRPGATGYGMTPFSYSAVLHKGGQLFFEKKETNLT